MFKQLINRLKGIEPCVGHLYELTDAEDIGDYSIIWQYTITCMRCYHKERLYERELKKKIELGLVDIEEEVIKNIFKNSIDEEIPKAPKPREI